MHIVKGNKSKLSLPKCSFQFEADDGIRFGSCLGDDMISFRSLHGLEIT